MSLSPTDAWNRLLVRAFRELPEQSVRTWLEPIEPLTLDDDHLVVGAPDQFAADWNNAKFADVLASYASVAIGHPLKVNFTVSPIRAAAAQTDLFVAQPEVVPTAAPASRSPEVHGRYTFNHFIIGHSNEAAYAAARAIVEAPGKLYNPLFVYGATGLGKTHLMWAIGHEVLGRSPTSRVQFVTTDTFTNEMVNAVRTLSHREFQRRYVQADVLLVDDVHFLKDRERTQEEFYFIFNALHEAGHQIVLTSDRAPSDIRGVQARLVSRFHWGQVVEIATPDVAHRLAILREKASHLQLQISDEVLRFVAEREYSNVRVLESALIRVSAGASLRQEAPTIALAQEMLEGRGSVGREAPISGTNGSAEPFEEMVVRIRSLVAHEWGVSVEDLQSSTRTKDLVAARQVTMYLMREVASASLVEIGRALGRRDHSTVIYGLRRVTEAMAVDATFARRVSRLLTQLRGSLAARPGV